MERRLIGIALMSLAVAFALAATGDTMRIDSLTADSAIVPLGGVVILRCRVANMDIDNFVRYLKLLPGDAGSDRVRGGDPIALTTNSAKENSIATLERYAIKRPEKNDVGGYDFILNITDARVEDSGTYLCTIPQLDITRHIDISIVNDPTSIQLYIDDRPISYDGERVDLNEVGEHNVTCTASGGNPQPVLGLILAGNDLEPTSTSSFCRVEPNMEASFLAHVTCTTTATVSGLSLDYVISGRMLVCTARSRGSPLKPTTMHLIPVLAGGTPEVTCSRVVTAKVHQKDVHLLCQVVSYPPLTDVYIHWNAGSGFLRPVVWQNGIKLARDGHFVAYIRPQHGNYSLLELSISHVYPQMFGNYHFVAVNPFGAVGHLVTLEREMTAQAVRSVESSPSRSSANFQIVDVVSSYLLLIFVTCLTCCRTQC